MSESQSRYSIVERLTKFKLDIMNNKSKLKENVKAKEQFVVQLKREFEDWKKDVQEDIKREQRKKEIEIQKAGQEYTNSQEQLNEKEKMFDEQLEAITIALHSIEEISKTSPTIQS